MAQLSMWNFETVETSKKKLMAIALASVLAVSVVAISFMAPGQIFAQDGGASEPAETPEADPDPASEAVEEVQPKAFPESVTPSTIDNVRARPTNNIVDKETWYAIQWHFATGHGRKDFLISFFTTQGLFDLSNAELKQVLVERRNIPLFFPTGELTQVAPNVLKFSLKHNKWIPRSTDIDIQIKGIINPSPAANGGNIGYIVCVESFDKRGNPVDPFTCSPDKILKVIDIFELGPDSVGRSELTAVMYTVESDTRQVPPFTGDTFTVRCETGDQATGGGVNHGFFNPNGGFPNNLVDTNRSIPDGDDGWKGSVNNYSSLIIGWSVHVRCLDIT